ncbi:hypothetical protein FJN16_13035 [Tannerella forsythia]|nr:hypothetical protein FJN16_13035 [Tannerella forsythia]
MSVYMPKINYILLIYRNLFLAPIHTSKLLLLNSLMELLGTNTDIHLYFDGILIVAKKILQRKILF